MATDWIVNDNIACAYNYSNKVNRGRGATVAQIKRQIKLIQEQCTMSEREASEYIKRQYRKDYQQWYQKLIGG